MTRHRDLDELGRLTESFFRDHLGRARGASTHTVRAYRDALRMFFMHVGDTTRRSVALLTLADLTAERVTAFLDHLESGRRNGRATRNQRLAAIRAFFGHLIRHDPTRAGQYQRVLSLPRKTATTSPPRYLEPDDVRALIDAIDPLARGGRRDLSLLLLLYNTGARVGEALGLRWRDVRLERPPQVLLHGKGSKDRWCPLWVETCRTLRSLAEQDGSDPDGVIFRNACGRPLSRDGVAHILRKHAAHAACKRPVIKPEMITPHVLRHSCAVALLQAGIDVTVIRDYLGHASIATTSRYLSTNLDMKRQVLKKFWKEAGLTTRRSTPWRPRAGLIAFLEGL